MRDLRGNQPRGDRPTDDQPTLGSDWLAARRLALLARCAGSADTNLAASSGCAASGAHRHATSLAEEAAQALARLDAGLLGTCETCSEPIPLARLDALVAAVRCARCAAAP